MIAAEKLISIIKEKVGTKTEVYTMYAVVKSIEKDNTCTVLLTDSDLEMSGVLLTAQQENTLGVVKKPAVDSAVLVSCIGNDINSLYISKTTVLDSTEVTIGDTVMTVNESGITAIQGDEATMAMAADNFTAQIGDTKLQLTSGGFEITDGTNSLQNLLELLITEVSSIVVVQGKTPNVANLKQIQTKLNNLLTV